MSTVPYKRLNKDDAVVLLVDHQTGFWGAFGCSCFAF